jgi:hypothetical protein
MRDPGSMGSTTLGDVRVVGWTSRYPPGSKCCGIWLKEVLGVCVRKEMGWCRWYAGVGFHGYKFRHHCGEIVKSVPQQRFGLVRYFHFGCGVA